MTCSAQLMGLGGKKMPWFKIELTATQIDKTVKINLFFTKNVYVKDLK